MCRELTMDFDKFKAAFQEKAFEGQRFDRPASEVAAEVRRKAMELDRRHLVRDVCAAATTLGLLALVAVFLCDAQSVLARAGLILAMLALAMETGSCLVLRLRARAKRYELPGRRYLVEERRKLAERVRMMKCQAGWLALPGYVGALVYVAALSKSSVDVIVAAGLVTASAALAVRMQERRIRKEIEPEIVQIDRQLMEYEVEAV
jgi:hypothetical protein